MKKISILALYLLLVLFSGCMRSVQLNERAIVQAVGLDWKDSEYALTMQIFDPEAAQGDDTSGGKMLRVTGKTISQAMRNANLKQGQEIFWGHTKLIIIGEQIAKDGIESVMAYFNADAQSRPNIDVLIADGEAGEVLSEPLDSTILPVLSTKMMLEGYQDNGKLVRSQLRGILGSLENPAVGAYLPMAAFSGDEENPGIQIVGTAILRDGRIAGTFSPEETRGILWAAGEVGKTQLTLEDNGLGVTTLDVVDSDVTVTVHIRDGMPFYEVLIQIKSNVSEELSPIQGLSLAERCDRYEKEQQQLVSQETEHALERLFHELSCDALGYANVLMQQQPEYWKANKDHYTASLKDILFSVTVNSTINRGGTTVS